MGRQDSCECTSEGVFRVRKEYGQERSVLIRKAEGLAMEDLPKEVPENNASIIRSSEATRRKKRAAEGLNKRGF